MTLDNRFLQQPLLATELYLAASEIVDDFEDYGPVLQANADGSYDESTVIGRLILARNRVLAALRSAQSLSTPE